MFNPFFLAPALSDSAAVAPLNIGEWLDVFVAAGKSSLVQK